MEIVNATSIEECLTRPIIMGTSGNKMGGRWVEPEQDGPIIYTFEGFLEIFCSTVSARFKQTSLFGNKSSISLV